MSRRASSAPAFQIGCVSDAMRREDRRRTVEQARQLGAFLAERAGERDARQVGGARHVDARAGGAQSRLGLHARRGGAAAGRTAGRRARRRPPAAARLAATRSMPRSSNARGERPSTNASARSASPRARSMRGICASLLEQLGLELAPVELAHVAGVEAHLLQPKPFALRDDRALEHHAAARRASAAPRTTAPPARSGCCASVARACSVASSSSRAAALLFAYLPHRSTS